MPAPDTLRVHIPLELRRRGGRPRILPPKHVGERPCLQPTVVGPMGLEVRAEARHAQLADGRVVADGGLTEAEGSRCG